MSILIATAATIGGSGPLTSASDAAKALEPVAGAAAETLFAIGLLGASALAAAVVPLSTAYGLAEAVGAERSVSKRLREAPLFLGLFTAQVVIGAAVALIPVNLIDLLLTTQILNGFITPVILVFLYILTNRREVVGEAVNGPRFKVFALDLRDRGLDPRRRGARRHGPRLVRRLLSRPLPDQAGAGLDLAVGEAGEDGAELGVGERVRGAVAARVDRERDAEDAAVGVDERGAGVARGELRGEHEDVAAGRGWCGRCRSRGRRSARRCGPGAARRAPPPGWP